MIWAVGELLLGIALLICSADRFVKGAAATARYLGMPSLLIGMLVVGFGTSLPEMLVSAQAALRDTSGIALGNAYGSNIAAMSLILGLTALMHPLTVHSGVLRKELPVLALSTGLAAWQLRDARVTHTEALVLLGLFGVLVIWSIVQGFRSQDDRLGQEIDQQLQSGGTDLRRALTRLVVGLALLIVSSRMLVQGAVFIAQAFGISDLIVGLTIVAIGTSLPELASAIVATRKGEHDIALGNILGSCLFNNLAVVGLAGAIRPIQVEARVFTRDIPVMGGLTLMLFVIGRGFKNRPGRVNRIEGGLLVLCYLLYTIYLIATGNR